MKTVTKAYFGTVCAVPVLLGLQLALYLLAPTVEGHDVFYAVWMVLSVYLWTGMIFLLIHLWMGPQRTWFKTGWSLLIVLLGFIALPVFWVRYFLLLDSGRVVAHTL